MSAQTQVTASAPGKLLLFGEHAVVYGHPCIVTAVDQRMFVTIRKNGSDVFRMDAPDIGLTAYSKTLDQLGKKDLPKEVQFVELLYRRFLEQHPQKEGIDSTTRSEFSASFGFGSSSAVTVAFASALFHLYQIEVSPMDLFKFCYQAVLDVQGVGSGFDIASAIWGKTIYYVPPAKEVRPLDIAQLPLLVGYTGVKADTPTLIRVVQQLQADKPQKVNTIFESINGLVQKAEEAIAYKDWEAVGWAMNQNQAELRKLQISSVELEQLIHAATSAGAYGAKLSGAGGGDCMIALCSVQNRPQVAAAITAAGGSILEVSLSAPGVRIET